MRTCLARSKRRTVSASTHMTMLRVSLAATALALLAACESEELVKPLPPDTSELLEDLDAPSGALDGVPPAEQAAVLEAALAQVERVCGAPRSGDCEQGVQCGGCALLDRLTSTIRQVAGSIDGRNRQQTQVSIPGVEGILFAHVTCPGWSADASRSSSGDLDATIGFTGRGLDPLVWGRFDRCRQGRGEAAFELTGDFSITFTSAEPIPFALIEQSTAVIGYEGTLRLRSASMPTPLRFALRTRLDGIGARTLMFDTGSFGTFVAELREGDVRVRGRDVSFRCDLSEVRCEASTR